VPRRRAGDPAAGRTVRLAAEWSPAISRVLLGLVLAWFGYRELVRPGLWTGYVPVLEPASGLAVIAVLAHGWVLLVLAAALIAGVAPRTAAADDGDGRGPARDRVSGRRAWWPAAGAARGQQCGSGDSRDRRGAPAASL